MTAPAAVGIGQGGVAGGFGGGHGGGHATPVSQTTGAIDGKVTDTSDAVLPGVTVTIASESMMGTRDTVTNETGTYRFVSITPGLYEVTFELPLNAPTGADQPLAIAAVVNNEIIFGNSVLVPLVISGN